LSLNPYDAILRVGRLLDRSTPTCCSSTRGRPPQNKNKELRFPPDPPTVEEIIAVMRAGGDDRERLGCVG